MRSRDKKEPEGPDKVSVNKTREEPRTEERWSMPALEAESGGAPSPPTVAGPQRPAACHVQLMSTGRFGHPHSRARSLTFPYISFVGKAGHKRHSHLTAKEAEAQGGKETTSTLPALHPTSFPLWPHHSELAKKRSIS